MVAFIQKITVWPTRFHRRWWRVFVSWNPVYWIFLFFILDFSEAKPKPEG